MNRELCRAFNEEVHRYKNLLLSCAKRCEWETFKLYAGRLFDYVEAIELSEIERRFHVFSRAILVVLFLLTVFVLRIDLELYPDLARAKNLITLSAIAGCGFEVYFYLSFRLYVKQKTDLYKKRRERFILNLERDFREVILPALT